MSMNLTIAKKQQYFMHGLLIPKQFVLFEHYEYTKMAFFIVVELLIGVLFKTAGFNDENQAEQLRASVDFLVELCNTSSPVKWFSFFSWFLSITLRDVNPQFDFFLFHTLFYRFKNLNSKIGLTKLWISFQVMMTWFHSLDLM